MADYLKTAFGAGMNRWAERKIDDAAQIGGKDYPCSVVAVVSSGIVTVKFEVDLSPFTPPQVTIPVLAPEYIRYPITVGDKGLAVSADVWLGAISGLGSGTPGMAKPPNLSALAFLWIGNKAWTDPIDPMAVEVYGPGGVILHDTAQSSILTLTPPQVEVDTPVMATTGNLTVGTGATGTFATASGQVVTVQDGIVINIT